MRIVFTLGGTDGGRSGLGSYVRAVLPELARRTQLKGDRLVVLGSEGEFDSYSDCLVGLETLSAPDLSSAFPSALWYLTSAGHRARQGGDVILYSAGNRRLGMWNPIPSVAVVHDLGQLHVPEKYDALRMAYVRYGLLSCFKRATRLVAISQATRDDLIAATGVNPDRVDVVPNGVDAERFSPRDPADPAVARARADLGLDRPYVLYPARLEHPAKNHLRLVEAYVKSRIASTHDLVLMGGDWGARSSIQEAVSRFDARGRIHLTGYVAEALVPLVIAGAAGIVMVGLREGFGLPALEGLSAGRPVCASETGALPEVVGDLAALCDPYDVESIGRALDRLVFDEKLARRARELGPEHARARGWVETARGLHRACRRAVAHSRLSSPLPESLAPISEPIPESVS